MGTRGTHRRRILGPVQRAGPMWKLVRHSSALACRVQRRTDRAGSSASLRRRGDGALSSAMVLVPSSIRVGCLAGVALAPSRAAAATVTRDLSWDMAWTGRACKAGRGREGAACRARTATARLLHPAGGPIRPTNQQPPRSGRAGARNGCGTCPTCHGQPVRPAAWRRRPCSTRRVPRSDGRKSCPAAVHLRLPTPAIHLRLSAPTTRSAAGASRRRRAVRRRPSATR